MTIPRHRLQSAYEKLISQELCYDLARKHGLASVARDGDDFGSTLFRYKEIALKFRQLDDALPEHYETDESLAGFLFALDACLRRYVFARIDGSKPGTFNQELLAALAKEHARDRTALLGFLSEMFTRWRSILAPNSLLRERILTLQMAARGDNASKIVTQLRELGVLGEVTKERQETAARSKIRKYLSRDTKNAEGQNFGFGIRRPNK
jgi:hypothetical protein